MSCEPYREIVPNTQNIECEFCVEKVSAATMKLCVHFVHVEKGNLATVRYTCAEHTYDAWKSCKRVISAFGHKYIDCHYSTIARTA